MERAILDSLQTVHGEALDAVMPWVSRICDHGEVWLLLALLLLLRKKTRRHGTALLCALALNLLTCNVLLKPLVGRTRPFVGQSIRLLIDPPLDASFPSGHTSSSFAAVLALRKSNSRLWKPALVLAALIAFSRLYLYVHWPSDVAGGAVLGAAMGTAGAKLSERIPLPQTGRKREKDENDLKF